MTPADATSSGTGGPPWFGLPPELRLPLTDEERRWVDDKWRRVPVRTEPVAPALDVRVARLEEQMTWLAGPGFDPTGMTRDQRMERLERLLTVLVTRRRTGKLDG